MVYDGTQTGNSNRLKGHLDGVAQTLSYQNTIPATTTSTAGPFGMGGTAADADAGIIDDVRIYNRALSGAEVAQLYSSTSKESDIMYNSGRSLMQYCDGTSWINIP